MSVVHKVLDSYRVGTLTTALIARIIIADDVTLKPGKPVLLAATEDNLKCFCGFVAMETKRYHVIHIRQTLIVAPKG